MRRRKFIENAVWASTMPLIMNSCPSPMPQKKEKSIGVALLGLGSYSLGQLAPALQLTDHCHLAGLVTGTPSKLPALQEQYGIPDSHVYTYDSMDEIGDNDDIDVIYIVVPTALHAKYAIRAAEIGKHVWCEKPMAMNTAECQGIIDACHKNKVKLSIGYRMLHEANTQALINYRDTKPYGNITSVYAAAGYRGGGGTGWRHRKSMGGGAMYDMGVYTVNGIRYTTGLQVKRVVEARHIINRPELFVEVDETTTYTLEMDNGLIAQGWTSVGENKNILHVDCDEGWYELSPMQSYHGVVGQTSDGIKLDTFVPNQQARQMDDNALAIINDTPVIAPGSEGMIDIHIINGIFEAARTGQSVDL